MAPDLLLCGLLTFAIASSFLLLRSYNYLVHIPQLRPGQPPLPPGTLGLPLLGQTLELFRDFKRFPDQFWRRRYARYGRTAGLFKTHLFGSPTIIATVPETLRTIFFNDEIFAPGWPKSTMRLAGGKSFLVLRGDDYNRLRRLASSSISSPRTLKRVVTSVETLTKEALEKWSHKEQVLLAPELLHLTFGIISRMIASNLPSQEIREFCDEFNFVSQGLRSLPINFPGFAFYGALKARRRIAKRIQGYIDDRLGQGSVVHGDVLESLMNVTDETGKKLSSEEIIDIIVTFLLAGHDSSAHTAMWIIIFLSQNPDKLEKVVDEQTRLLAEKDPSESLSVTDYKRMTYLNWVIDETLRIINISPFTFRKVMETTECNGFTLPKNWIVALWLRAIHLDEDLYPDPHSFKPERWQDIKLKPAMYAPFGLGGRSCIGMELAKLELAVLVHNLVLNYRWELVNPTTQLVYLPRMRPIDDCPIRILLK